MKLKISPVLLSLLGGLIIPLHVQAQPQLNGNLTITVQGLQSQDGNLCVKLFNGSEGFPNDNDSAVKRECLAIADNLPENPTDPFSVTFTDLEFGTYAVAIYHDSNGDEQLDRADFGMPTEGYGFSNDAPAVTGPPNYGDALFLLAGQNTTVSIQMQYP